MSEKRRKGETVLTEFAILLKKEAKVVAKQLNIAAEEKKT